MAVFECDGCGACCKTFPIFAAETDDRREPRIRDESRRLPLWLATPEWTYQLFPLPFHRACCFIVSRWWSATDRSVAASPSVQLRSIRPRQ